MGHPLIKKLNGRINLFVSPYVVMLAGILMISSTSFGQNPISISLDQAVDYAIEHNLTLQNARADVNIARKQVWEITADGLPQVNGSVDYQNFMDIPTQLIPAQFFGGAPGDFIEVKFGLKHTLNAGLTVSQLIFDGSYIVGLQAARIYSQLARQGYQRTETEVKSLVTENYYIALASSQNLDIIKQNLSNLEATLNETQKLYEEGFVEAIDVDQLKLTVANLRNTITSLTRQKALTLDLLKFQMGLDVEQPVELTDNLETLLSNAELEELLNAQFDYNSHIDYKISLSQERMSLMAMRRQKSFYLPRISAFYSHQQSAQRDAFNFLKSEESWFPTSVIGVNISIPIFSSGLRWSRIQQAKLDLVKTQNNRIMLEQSLLVQTHDAQNQLSSALDKYNSEKQSLLLAERILERTTIKHKEGLASSLELTQASDQFLSTQANYINAIFELLNSRNKLEKALGRY